MEEIWADLQRNPEDVPAPAWHGDVLRALDQPLCLKIASPPLIALCAV